MYGQVSSLLKALHTVPHLDAEQALMRTHIDLDLNLPFKRDIPGTPHTDFSVLADHQFSDPRIMSGLVGQLN